MTGHDGVEPQGWTSRLLEGAVAGRPSWRTREAMRLGLPTSGSSGKIYGGIASFVLWEAAIAASYRRNVWYTEAAVGRRGLAVAPGARLVDVQGRTLVNVDEVPGLEAPTPDLASALSRVRRVQRLVRFIDPQMRAGEAVQFLPSEDIIVLPTASSFGRADDYAISALAALVAWTGGQDRLCRCVGEDASEDERVFEALVVELGTALAAAWLELHGKVAPSIERSAVWAPALAERPELLGRAATEAHQALAYLQALAPADLHETRELPTRRGTATALGELLELSFDEVGKGRYGEEQLVLTLPRVPARHLASFIDDLAGVGRRNPLPVGLLTGGPGSGAPQVVAALSELLLTGGVDLDGALVRGENDDGALLEAISRVWGHEQIDIVPCSVPLDLSLAPDKAIPTACLSAFHAHRGRSATLWAARMEEALERAGELDGFTEAYHALVGRRWLGGANQDAVVDVERVIEALGGDPEDPEDEETRRIRRYESHRAQATWASLKDEVGTLLYAEAQRLASERGTEMVEDPPPRALFVVDLAPALAAHNHEAKRWRRRVLQSLMKQIVELSEAGETSTWFMLCSERPVVELSEAGGWSLEDRKLVRSHVALERHPVYGAFRQELLAKNLDECAGLYRLFADNRDLFERLSVLDDWAGGVTGSRDELVESFPFLPCILPLAQAVLDTLVRDGDPDQQTMPLAELVDRTLDEHFYGPPDRFVPLDVLFEPLLRRLDLDVEADTAEVPAPAMIFVPGTTAREGAPLRPRTFPDESILGALRLAGRVEGLPCTAANLVRLMFVRVEDPWEVLVEEVQGALILLKARGFVASQDDTHFTYLKAR